MTTRKPITVTVTNDAEEVRSLVRVGACPIECSIGGESIVDALVMDHHGQHSRRESVAVRAYRDHFAARAADPRFVIVGTADADATFAVAALAGLLPHPARCTNGAPPHIAAGLARDLTGLAGTIATIDTDPIGRDIAGMDGGEVLLAWNALTVGHNRDSQGALAGVQLWVTLTDGHPARRPLLAAAAQTETERRALAGSVAVSEAEAGGIRVGAVIDAPVFGFDVWYGRRPEFSGDDPRGWRRPVVLALARGAITIGCPNERVARAIFGPDGLKAVFPRLDYASKAGWGGREAVGGSPRGIKMTSEDLSRAVACVEREVRMNTTPCRRCGAVVSAGEREVDHCMGCGGNP